METLQPGGLEKFMRTTLNTFSPNEELCPEIQLGKATIVEGADLSTLKPGSFVFLRGMHPGADYTVRINQSSVDVWRNRNATGLRAPIESIVSWQGSPAGVQVQHGVVQKGQYSCMPYFSYENDKALPPTDVWGDKYMLIFVSVE